MKEFPRKSKASSRSKGQNTSVGDMVSAEKAVVTVGPAEGMFRGNDHFAIQGAIDYVARRGGGRVEIQAGDYFLRNALQVPGGVSLIGVGGRPVLRKRPSRATAFKEDLDWHHQAVRLVDADCCQVGDGLFLGSKRLDGGSALQIALHTVIAKHGDTLVLDRVSGFNHWRQHGARAVSIHSLIECRGAENVSVTNLVLDGNRKNNEQLDGNVGAGIYLYESRNVRISGIEIRDFNGDGVSWQASHHVQIEDCVLDNIAALGLHPGSGSKKAIIRSNTIQNCETGIFFCWGIEGGLAEGNTISDCSKHGISIGHRDSHNAIKNNQISHCREAGIFFRPERSPAHAAHRNLVEGNKISCPPDSKKARGIQLCRGVEDVILRKNHICIPSSQRTKALVIPSSARRIISESNRIEEKSPNA